MGIKFSVIVVCYNAGDKLRDTIDSILEQTYGEYEVIVKDASSTDNSLSKIPINDKIEIISAKDTGIYDGMNQAVSYATGDYYVFLNCGDSFYHKDTLEDMANFIEKKRREIGANEKEPLIYYGDTYNESQRSKVPMSPKITAFTCYRHFPCHQACFYAAELFRERKYDLHYIIRADYEHFLWCFFCKEANPCYTDMVIANYEGGGFSESRENHELDKREHKEITEKYMTSKQLFRYKVIMAVTLVPVRRYLASQKWFSGIYNGVKQVLYKH